MGEAEVVVVVVVIVVVVVVMAGNMSMKDANII